MECDASNSSGAWRRRWRRMGCGGDCCSFLAAVMVVPALLCFLSASDARVLNQDENTGGYGWITGRATYYGSPGGVDEAYKETRGEGAFGILSYGSCGYTELGRLQEDASEAAAGRSVVGGVLESRFQTAEARIPFMFDAVAAAADANPDYAGACGRCYEVRCRNGLVYANDTSPVRIVDGYYDGDFFRPYLPATTTAINDTRGRSWPGNPLEPEGLQFVRCNNDTGSIRVRIIDACPCKQMLPGETRTQEWCCGGRNHFDLSYWAFEKLAHPVYGVMGIDYRPVDCFSGAALQREPGYISRDVIYEDETKPGWEWHPYDVKYTRYNKTGAGVGGSAGTCIEASPQGGLSFRMRRGGRPGYQPFEGAKALSFWIRPVQSLSEDDMAAFKSLDGNNHNGGSFPDIKLFVMADDAEARLKQYCFEEFKLTSKEHVVESQADGWTKFEVPLSAFKCEGALEQEVLDRLDFQNIGESDVSFCLDELRLVR